MATGEVQASDNSAPAQEDLQVGEVVMSSGRLSVARRVEPDQLRLPFSPAQLGRVDEALVLSTRSTGLEFGIYLGELGESSRERAEELHAALGDRAPAGVLVAVSPGERRAEIVTGVEAKRRIPDRSCQLAMMSMVAFCKEDEILEGLIEALRVLSDAAGVKAAH